MKVLITGIAGFVGSYLADLLLTKKVLLFTASIIPELLQEI